MKVDVLRGASAVRDHLTPSRLAQWQQLVDRQQKVAIYQSPSFVLTWYEVYAAAFEPLLLLAESESGALEGVMPLALDGKQRVEIAGAEQAEYAGWVASRGLDAEFPARCIARVHELGVLNRRWLWKRQTPGAGVDWLEHPALRECGIGWQAQATPNPIVALGEDGAQRFFAANKRNDKRKANLLRRLGELSLVRLTAETLTDELLDHFATLCDIRYLARHGVTPFRSDPLKATFSRRLLERAPDTVLLFALMAGETPAAFHLSIADKQRAIFCMSPFDSRHGRSSPGKLIADRVAEELRALGMAELDMTPGDDAYKGEIASRWETVHSIELFPTKAQARLDAWRRSAVSTAKPVAARLGITRERVTSLGRLGRRLRQRSPREIGAAALKSLRERAWSKDVFVTYRLDPVGPLDPTKPLEGNAGLVVRRDELADFLCYSGSNPWVPPQQMMREAIRRLEHGEHCFTVVEDGVLQLYGWAQMKPKRVFITEVGMDLQPGPDDTALYDFYTEPASRGRGIYRRALTQVMRGAFSAGAKHIIGGAMDTNQASNRGIVNATLTPPLNRLVRMRIMGLTWKWEEPCA